MDVEIHGTTLYPPLFDYSSYLLCISSLRTGQKQLANDKHFLGAFVHFLTRKSPGMSIPLLCTEVSNSAASQDCE